MVIHFTFIFSRPDYTVGTGISPVQSAFTDSRALTAGRELPVSDSPCPEDSCYEPTLALKNFFVNTFSGRFFPTPLELVAIAYYIDTQLVAITYYLYRKRQRTLSLREIFKKEKES